MGMLTNSILFTISISLVVLIASTGQTIPHSCDIFSNFFETSGTGLSPTGEFNASLPTQVESGSISTGSSFNFSFIDVIKYLLKFINFLLGMAFAPLTCGASLGLPFWLQLLLCIPALMTIFGIVFLIRGSSGGS